MQVKPFWESSGQPARPCPGDRDPKGEAIPDLAIPLNSGKRVGRKYFPISTHPLDQNEQMKLPEDLPEAFRESS